MLKSFKLFNSLPVQLAVIILVLFAEPVLGQNEVSATAAWAKLPSILETIKEPIFKNKTYNILDFGGKSGGVFDNTQVFKKAIQKCTKNGGGIVLVPAGKYFTGPIHLDNNVNLHLAENSEIVFNTNTDAFPMVHTSFEGTELMNYSPLIYAYNKHNVAVTGEGILNGQGSNDKWWSWCGKPSYGCPKN
jgi:polygalacturonase